MLGAYKFSYMLKTTLIFLKKKWTKQKIHSKSFLFMCFENTNPVRFDITDCPIILKRYFLINRPLLRGGRLISTGRLINAGRLLNFVEITWALIERGRLINAGRLIGYLRYLCTEVDRETIGNLMSNLILKEEFLSFKSLQANTEKKFQFSPVLSIHKIYNFGKALRPF